MEFLKGFVCVMKLLEKVKSLPESPGVYLMKGQDGQILYGGKASSLKKRVSSYFTSSPKLPRQAVLLNKVIDIDFVLASSEAEALILEAGLIKEYKPKYNVAIKDDKAYPCLKLTVNEKFARLRIVRRKKKDGAKYFGPYTSGKLLRQALNFMRRIFPLRTCNIMPRTLCLNYHLKQCIGPCALAPKKEEYDKIVGDLLLFLQGRKSDLIKRLSEQMHNEARLHNFEEAIKLRDRIEALSSVRIPGKKSKIIDQIEELGALLRLKRRPLLIEGFDLSAISGVMAVGAMVRFKNGYPCKKEYRRFKIKTVGGIDDYAMLEEIISRRFSGSLAKELSLPDLILIDGGKGHLQCAERQIEKTGRDIPLVSIAKKFEHIYVQWQSQPISLPQDSKALRLLMRLRDEAHRFALAYHKSLRKKQMLLSELDQIAGIGPKRRKVLLERLDSILNLKGLSVRQLKEIRGIDEKTAKNIIEHWKKY